jgi:hypothetical protein
MTIILPALLTLIFLLLHFRFSAVKQQDAAVLLLCCGAGFVFDSVLQWFGLASFSMPNPEPLARLQPLWMACLWAAFACTLNHSMAWLRQIPSWASVFLCGVMGYLSYVGASKLGALQLAPGTLPVLALCFFWGLFIPLVQQFKRPA